MKKIVLIGSGGFAKEILFYSNDVPEIEVIGYIDVKENNKIKNYIPYLGNDNNNNVSNDAFFILSIGLIDIRMKLVSLFGEERFYTFIHPSARIANTATIGKGTIVCPDCYIGPDVIVGKFGLINYHSFIPHNCSIGNFSFLAPLTNIGGDAIIGDNFFAGVSATIIPRIKIGNNVSISAGTLVTRNVPDDSMIFCNPSKIFRKTENNN